MAKRRYHDADDEWGDDEEDRLNRKKSIRDQRRQAQSRRESMFNEAVDYSDDE